MEERDDSQTKLVLCGSHVAMMEALTRGGSAGQRRVVARSGLRARPRPGGPLFNDPRDVLEQELRQTENYYGLLEALSTKREMSSGDLANAVKKRATSLPQFLETLQEMRLVERRVPYGSDYRARGHYRLSDPFLRFWFRYVFPYQEDLAAGLGAEGQPDVVLLCRGGFTDGLREREAEDPKLRLVDASELMLDLA